MQNVCTIKIPKPNYILHKNYDYIYNISYFVIKWQKENCKLENNNIIILIIYNHKKNFLKQVRLFWNESKAHDFFLLC